MAIWDWLSNAVGYFSEYRETILNVVIIVLTVLLEELFTTIVYYCPCVDPSQLGDCFSTSDSENSSSRCTVSINRSYGFAYMFAPAIALFFIMAAMNRNLWKIFTGCLYKSKALKARDDMICWTLSVVCARALIAPFAWICFALLDGRYLACAITPLPYDVGSGATYSSCNNVAAQENAPNHSDAYRDNRSYSQIFGWVIIATIVVIGYVTYAVSKCVYPLTYFQAKYYDLYQKYEEDEFTDEMTIKAQRTAETNIRKFMAVPRDKADWDQISTVFAFHRNPENIALYSYLDEFIVDEENEAKKPLINDNDNDDNASAVTMETDDEEEETMTDEDEEPDIEDDIEDHFEDP